MSQVQGWLGLQPPLPEDIATWPLYVLLTVFLLAVLWIFVRALDSQRKEHTASLLQIIQLQQSATKEHHESFQRIFVDMQGEISHNTKSLEMHTAAIVALTKAVEMRNGQKA